MSLKLNLKVEVLAAYPAPRDLLMKACPGIFFILPCIEAYQKVDLRTITLDVPPQEVSIPSLSPLPSPQLLLFLPFTLHQLLSLPPAPGADAGLRDGVGGRGGLLQGLQRHHLRGQRGERSPLHQVGWASTLQTLEKSFKGFTQLPRK